MRLLNTKHFSFGEFFDTDIPPYVILSHTWEDEEVSYKDMRKGRFEGKKGYAKIKKCCEIALADHIDWAWIDTCCIDKGSSADLSEAINSMYKWYLRAKVCYAFISDVSRQEDLFGGERPRWFTRGWTLQELIAPRQVVFFSRDWEKIGTRDSLSKEIATSTGIKPSYVLEDRYEIQKHGFSVAQRMSWVSTRRTSRNEDMAYCLMGLFEVNMPILYGEGSKKAFRRLQEEILRNSSDHSLFAWCEDTDTGALAQRHWRSPYPMLAGSPKYFAQCADVNRSSHKIAGVNILAPYFCTNIGISMSLPLSKPTTTVSFALLNCTRGGKNIAIEVKKTGPRQFHRCSKALFEMKRLKSGGWVVSGKTAVREDGKKKNETIEECNVLNFEMREVYMTDF